MLVKQGQDFLPEKIYIPTMTEKFITEAGKQALSWTFGLFVMSIGWGSAAYFNEPNHAFVSSFVYAPAASLLSYMAFTLYRPGIK